MITAEKKGGKELQKFLIKDINDLIAGLVKDNPLNRKDITAVVCSGNTIMSHFLLGLETKNIRRSPYIPVTVEPQPICASDVGIKIGPGGLLYPLPCISGWVGSDITAGILATGIHKKEEISLLIDMGTNGEMVVGNKEWMVASSASAGPALEGEGVACGMMAEMGAIEHFFLKEGQITCQTIGNLPAKGICGSGIIDLVNVLLKKQVIDRSGTFMDKEITKFHITDNIYICESDLESIITAKAAIYAALKILLKRLHLSLSDISHLYIAGAFGKYINKENAIAIGLIPNISHEKIEYVGNTSIRGSRVVALHEETFQEITEIARKATYYDLMGESDYVEEFKKALFLPHTDIEEFKRVIS